MKSHFLLLPLFLSVLLARGANDQSFQKAFDEAVRLNPPGDYNSMSPLRTERTLIIHSKGFNDDVSNPLVTDLNKTIIPSFTLKDTTVPKALKDLSNIYSKANPAEENLNIVFDLDLILDSKPLKENISMTFENVPAMEILRYITGVPELKYRIQDRTIIIFSHEKAQQGAAANP